MELETLWKTIQKPLKTFIIRRTHRPQDAEDILQDVFLKVYTNMDNLQDKQKLRPWIYQIARHSIIDYYRKGKPMGQLPDELPQTTEVNETNGNREMANCLRPLIRQLPDKYREAIELTEFEGLSQKQLSDKLGISFSGAKSRVQRGKRKLKEIISDCCHLEFDCYGNILDYKEKNPEIVRCCK